MEPGLRPRTGFFSHQHLTGPLRLQLASPGGCFELLLGEPHPWGTQQRVKSGGLWSPPLSQSRPNIEEKEVAGVASLPLSLLFFFLPFPSLPFPFFPPLSLSLPP